MLLGRTLPQITYTFAVVQYRRQNHSVSESRAHNVLMTLAWNFPKDGWQIYSCQSAQALRILQAATS